MGLRVLLAGRIALESDGAVVEADGVGRLGRLAFAYLVTERRRPVPHDELADVLWAEDLPRSWPTSLRVLVSKLRSFLVRGGLDREALVTEDGCLRLTLPAGAVVDVEEAAEVLGQAEEALAGEAERARKLAGETLVVASRQFLPGGTGTWAEHRQAEIRDLHVRALEVLAAACSACGDGATAVSAAEAAVALEPFRESAWLLLIEAHAAAGNRAEALRAYGRCRHQLVEELGVGPSAQTEAAYEALLDDGPVGGTGAAGAARSVGVAVAPAALPQPVTSFVGRADDLAEVDRLLTSSRLVTLVGPGGVGKSRLALEVAARAAPEVVGGVALVELGRLADPELVDVQVLAALGLAEMPGATAADSVIAHLGERPMLLVLDNCEHVLDAAATLVDRLLRGCPDVRVLATSRERLATAGEAAWPVRALTVPTDEAGSAADDLLGYEAVRLLFDRARSVVPDFELDDTNAGAAVQVCRGLDGVPLALELAAARVGALSLSDIAARLADRFTLLTSGDRTARPHHRTLRATVEWSYDALSPEERAAFDRVAVFSGGFTLAAAEEVCADRLLPRSTVAQLVARLVETSLITRDDRSGAHRYVAAETIRQFGREQLDRDRAADSVRARHLEWTVRTAHGVASSLVRGGDQARSLDVLDREQDNFRVALGWADAGVDRLSLAVALGRFWELRGHLTEGRRWLDAIMADPQAEAAPPALRAGALNCAGVLAQRQGDYRAAFDYFQRSLAIVRDLGDRLGMATALHGLGNLAALQGDPAARFFFEESLAIGRELDVPHVIAASLTNLGSVAQNQGDLATARELAAESLALRRELDDQHGVAMVLGNLGYLAYQQGDFATAKALDDESLALRRELGDQHGVAMVLGNLGHLALQAGDLVDARLLYEESLALRRMLDDRHGEAGSLANLADLARMAGDLTTARSLLDEALRAARELGDRYRIASLLVRRARLADELGDHAGAARLALDGLAAAGDAPSQTTLVEILEELGSAMAGMQRWELAVSLWSRAAAMREAIGAPRLPRDRDRIDGLTGKARASLGDARFGDAEAKGLAANLTELIALSGEGY